MLRHLIKAMAPLCAALTLAITTGCANDAPQTASDASGAPKCQAVWTVGKTLPQDYRGCLGDDGQLVTSGVSYCADGTQFTTHENHFFARLGGTIGAGPEGSPGAKASYSRFWSRCQKTSVPATADDQASSSAGKSESSKGSEHFQTFAGDIFTVDLLDTTSMAAEVRFCATAPYQGSSIPVTRSPWSLQDQQGTLWSADEGHVDLPGSAYPVEATVGVGDCLQGWVPFDAPASTTPVRVVYDSSIGGPFMWDLAPTGTNSVPPPPASEPLAVPSEPPARTRHLPAFEIRYIKTVAKRVLDDTAEIDCRMKDGIGVATRVDMLGDDYATLVHGAALPPGAPARGYHARATTLASFAHRAADEIYNGDEVDGYARYTVVRKEGKPLLAMINRSLGTEFHYFKRSTC